MILNNRQKYAIRRSVFVHVDSKSIVENFDEDFTEDLGETREAIEDYILEMYECILQKEGIQDE